MLRKGAKLTDWWLIGFMIVLVLALVGCTEISEPVVNADSDDATLELLDDSDAFTGILLNEDITPEESLTGDWWQWFSSTEDQGDVCDENQPQEGVWYLAGTNLDPTSKNPNKVERECVIPSGRKILFPIINVLCGPDDPDAPVKDPEDSNNEISLSCVNFLVSNMKGLALKISADDKILDLHGNENIPQVIYTFDCDVYGENCQSGGYWALIELSPGEYEVNFRGRLKFKNDVYGSFNSALNITYELVVEDVDVEHDN